MINSRLLIGAALAIALVSLLVWGLFVGRNQAVVEANRSHAVKPPQRGTLSQMPQVWGVVVDEATGLVYASDMNSGLWILRVTG